MKTIPNALARQSSPEAEDRLLTKKEAARRLSVSVRTLDRMILQGWLDKVFLGASPRIRKSDIDVIIERGI